MTLDEFRSLEPGDRVEMGRLMPGLPGTVVAAVVEKVDVAAEALDFALTVHGVTLGEGSAFVKGGAVQWKL